MIGKLGKLEPKRDARTLWLADYLETPRLPPLPLSRAWSPKCDPVWPMLGNDLVGCCTCAAAGHMIATWTANEGHQITLTEAEVLAAYSAISGYVPGQPDTDRGAYMLDALKHWRNVGIGGHKILAFAKLNPADHTQILQAVELFGAVYLGLWLPTTAQGEAIWANTGGTPGSWGGHAVGAMNWDPYTRTCVTWGHTQKMTPEFHDRYCDEAYAVLSEDWTGPDRVAPNGFDLDRLLEDLGRVTG
ncbi:MAG TPA: hypothetical protein VM487_09565 [Phycisphaerae bacterium]|nr:hypothetical protein [Phycisphaerae bacterium]